MEKYCTLYLVPDIATYIMCFVGSLTTVATFVSNLTMMIYFQKIKHKMGGLIFYRFIIYISMFASLIGQPLEMANALLKTTNLILNMCSNACLFLLFSATYHCIAGLVFERYIIIKGDGKKKGKEKRVLAVTITILVTLMCIPKFYNIFQIILKRHYCEKPPDSWLTIGTMCTWLTYCSFVIAFLTKKAVRFVEKYDKIRKENFGKSQATNLKRLKVTKKIWIVFSSLWLPYGVINMLQNVLSPAMYELLNAIARGLTFGSFAVLPTVYYFMDKNYATYIDKKLYAITSYIHCIDKSNTRSTNRVVDVHTHSIARSTSFTNTNLNITSRNIRIIQAEPITENQT